MYLFVIIYKYTVIHFLFY